SRDRPPGLDHPVPPVRTAARLVESPDPGASLARPADAADERAHARGGRLHPRRTARHQRLRLCHPVAEAPWTRTAMRILLVTHYFPEHRSGIVIVASELARRLAQRGAQVVWAASNTHRGAGPEGVRRLPMSAWNVTERRLGFPYPLWGPLSLWRLGRAVRASQAVHLHDSLYLGNVAAWLWARWYRKPVVVTQHIGPIPYSNRILRGLLGLANRTLGRWVLGGCDKALFISPRVQAYFGRLVRFRRAPLYLPNGVNT